jgi:hypothetical protein
MPISTYSEKKILGPYLVAFLLFEHKKKHFRIGKVKNICKCLL